MNSPILENSMISSRCSNFLFFRPSTEALNELFSPSRENRVEAEGDQGGHLSRYLNGSFVGQKQGIEQLQESDLADTVVIDEAV